MTLYRHLILRLAHRKLRRAQARLQRVTDERARSFEVEQYRRRRAAGKLGWQHRKGAAA